MVTGGVEVRVRLTPSSEVRCGDVVVMWRCGGGDVAVWWFGSGVCGGEGGGVCMVVGVVVVVCDGCSRVGVGLVVVVVVWWWWCVGWCVGVRGGGAGSGVRVRSMSS